MVPTKIWRFPLLGPILVLVLSAEAKKNETKWYTNHAQALYDDLFGNFTHDNYNVKVIPISEVEADNKTIVPLKVSTEVVLTKISDFNSVSQAITVQAWMRLRWQDVQLKWNTTDYGGIDFIRVSPDRGWGNCVLFWRPISKSR